MNPTASFRLSRSFLAFAGALSLLAACSDHGAPPAASTSQEVPTRAESTASPQEKAIGQRYQLGQILNGTQSTFGTISESGLFVGTRPGLRGAGIPYFWSAATGTIALQPDTYGVASDVTSSGLVVGSTGSLPVKPFRWTQEGGLVELPLPPGASTGSASKVQSDGSILGSVGAEPYLWGADGVGQPIAALAGSRFLSASSDGHVLAFIEGAEASQNVFQVWSAATGTHSLSLPPGMQRFRMTDLGPGGQVLGWAIDGSSMIQILRWTPAGGLEFLGNTRSTTAGGFVRASRDGAVISDAQVDDLRPFYWHPAGGMRNILEGVAEKGQARNISPDGTVVGWYEGANGAKTAFAWSEATGLVNLNDRIDPALGIHLESGAFVSDSGYIVADASTGSVMLSPAGATPSAIPVLGAIEPTAPAAVNVPVRITVNFTDADANDSFTASIRDGSDAGPGAPAEVVFSNGTGTISGTVSFDSPGVREITVTLGDSAGNTAEAKQSIVTFDPAAGSVAGAGQFESPAGAFRADPQAIGRVAFAGLARYQADAATPTGLLTLASSLGNNTFFLSTSLDWLVIGSVGSGATFAGRGTINGRGSYRYVVDFHDQAQSEDPTDRIRVQIWSQEQGKDELVYDSPAVNVTRGDIRIVRR